MNRFLRFVRRIFKKKTKVEDEKETKDPVVDDDEFKIQEWKDIDRIMVDFFLRRGYDYHTKRQVVKMGNLYPDLSEFMPPTMNNVWQRNIVKQYPLLKSSFENY